jgi:hypothetical protein
MLSLLIGARTEELRAVTWDRVDLEGMPNANPPVPPSIEVWHSVREGRDKDEEVPTDACASWALCRRAS